MATQNPLTHRSDGITEDEFTLFSLFILVTPDSIGLIGYTFTHIYLKVRTIKDISLVNELTLTVRYYKL